MNLIASAFFAAGFYALTPQGESPAAFVRPDGEKTFMSAVEHLYRVYPEQWRDKTWASAVLSNLENWKFNALGPGPDRELVGKGFPYTMILWLAEPMTTSDDPDDYIYPTKNHQACTGFPNVFSPKWKERVFEAARKQCGKMRDDRSLIGYFLDNELRWWGDGNFGNNNNGLYDAIAKLPAGHSARKALEEFVKVRNATIENAAEPVRRAFVAETCERFFRDCRDAIRATDPNHLILGVRFAGLGGPDEAWRACGKYCDVVSFNIYPWTDLDRGTLADNGPGFGGKALRPAVEARLRMAGGRPMLISEWATMAFDSGLDCVAGAGQRFSTQTERTVAAETIFREFVSWPFLVGASWYRYIDNKNRTKTYGGEDCNYGLVDASGVPYSELTEMFRRLNPQIAKLRGKPRKEEPLRRLPDRFFLADEAERRGGKAKFAQTGNGFASGKIKLKPGAKRMFDSFELDGREFGAITAVVSVDGFETRRVWIGATGDSCARLSEDGAILSTTIHERGAAKMKVVARHVATKSGRIVSSLVSVENTGKIPLKLNGFYFQIYSPFAFEGESENMKVDGRKVWKPYAASAWIGTNGVFAGAVSSAPNARPFSFRRGKEGSGELYPDASYNFNAETPDEGLVLEPDGKWSAEGRIWIEWIAGEGDAAEWNRVRKEEERKNNPLIGRGK